MHIYFSGIGGAGIGPLALIAKQVGFEVSGSDKQNSSYIEYLKKKGITNIHIGQLSDKIAATHHQNPIDWFVYSSALTKENPGHPEFVFAREENIYSSKRDELLNRIIKDKKLKLLAIAGTHGKTTTTSMIIWLFKQLDIPISYSVGAKISFGDMGHYQKDSEYFIYECDEFDRNFLAFEPYQSIITGVTWDHHEIYPTREDYQQAFREFLSQSKWSILWREDYEYLELQTTSKTNVLETDNPDIRNIKLAGLYNRLDARLAIESVHEVTKEPIAKLTKLMNKFPGLQRRMEELIPSLYSDYAHTPEKIRGAMSVASEMANENGQKLVVVYEGLTNRRQHFMINDYQDCFNGADKLIWIPSYLAREDPDERIIEPYELIQKLTDKSIAAPMERNQELKDTIQKHLDDGDMVVGMAGGGGDSLDEWLRKEFVK